MKKFTVMILTAAMMSAFTLSSCLDDSDDGSSYPDYQCAVTVGEGAFMLYTDFGATLMPTTTVEGLSKLKRAVVAFDLASEESGKALEAGKTYNVVIDPYYSYSIPTSNVINLYENEAAVDSLVNTQDPITKLAGLYAVNGYANAYLSFAYNANKSPYVNAAFNSETDIDLENEKLNLTLYFDDAAEYYNTSTSNTLFSFRLPEMAYYEFVQTPSDSITLEMTYLINSIGDTEKQTCRMAKKDLIFTGF